MSDEALGPVFKALADPTRRTLLDRLREQNGQTLSELCRSLDMTRQSTTQHLDLLAGVNLVTVVRHGRQRRHYLNPGPIHEIERTLDRGIRRSPTGTPISTIKRQSRGRTP